ncbi:MAM domain-containing protein 2-like [Tubulanus polymorphus]|uniref:MAM domain-containing protein 2-like n=1 Tax=Tubulanus polymorphus TaxID=672921 RepID=UPI003DA39E25
MNCFGLEIHRSDGLCCHHVSTEFANETEDFEDGFGFWATSGSGSWKRYIGKTPSENTGPSGDHTSGGGYYIYLKSSQYGNYYVRLYRMLATTSNKCKMHFSYHMYDDMATMSSYLRLKIGSSQVFKLWGNQGNQWFTSANIDVPARVNQWIIFTGYKGYGSRFEMALDDIVFTNC